MSLESQRVVEGHLAELAREDLTDSPAPSPDLRARLQDYRWVRVSRLSSFWRSEKDNSETGALEEATLDFVSGLHGARFGLAYAIIGLPEHLEIWLGVERGADPEALPSALRGAFADIRFAPPEPAIPNLHATLKSGIALTGIPTWKRPEDGRQPRSDQIERICRALYGQTWAYLVFAQPRDQRQTREALSEATRLASDVQARFLLSTNAADQNDRSVKRLVELLDKNLERLDLGHASGMWLHTCWLLVAPENLIQRSSALLLAAFSGEDSCPVPLRIHPMTVGAPGLRPAPITSAELAALVGLPREEYSGYEIVRRVRYGVETNQHLKPEQRPVLVGHILDRGQPTGRALYIPRDDLTKHGLIVGVTGAGKTNTCFSLLEQVWDDGKGCPFMVIESAKSEYRALLKSPRFSGLRVFTVGDETISPLRLNPFDVPPGVHIQAHIDFLQALFGAAFVLYPPMPYVLAMSIQRVYEDKGWDLAANENRRGRATPIAFPTLDDLIDKVKYVSDSMGYEGEIRANIKAALEGRLNQLRIGGGKGIMLNCRDSIPSSELFEKPCLLELKQLVNDEEKAFLIGLLLIRLHEYYESQGRVGDGRLRHVTLIEEAHRLLKNTSTSQGGDSANPQGKAIEVFANLLAEIRAYGEGIFMAEQIPTKLAPEALKNTNLKLVQRLVAKDDREAVGATMNLDEDQIQSLTTLPAGQAVTYLEGLQKPVLLQIPLTDTKRHAVDMPAAAVREQMKPFWQENHRLRVRYPACLECGGGGSGCSRPAPMDEHHAAILNRLWVAFSFHPAEVQRIWAEWNRVQSLAANVATQSAPFCRAHAWFIPFLERRADYFQWPLKSTGNITALLVQTLQALRSDGQCASKVVELAEQLGKLQRAERDARPYPGCSLCPTPCHFRYELYISTDNTTAAEFVREFAAFEDRSLELAVNAAHLWIGDLSQESLHGAAYCYAVTSLQRRKFSLSNMEELLGKFKRALATRIFGTVTTENSDQSTTP